MTDPIADMLTRIRNAYLAGLKTTKIPHSKIKHALAEKLVELGYLDNMMVEEGTPNSHLVVKLKYMGKFPVMTGLVRVSKPGRRVYQSVGEIKSVLSGHGSVIISTSKGIMSDKQAREAGLGGEIICKIW